MKKFAFCPLCNKEYMIVINDNNDIYTHCISCGHRLVLYGIKYDEEINLERIMNYGAYSCSTERT